MTERPASNRDHWLTFRMDDEGGNAGVTGCHCGMRASADDLGYGDSVVDHLLHVGALNQIERTQGFFDREMDQIERELIARQA